MKYGNFLPNKNQAPETSEFKMKKPTTSPSFDSPLISEEQRKRMLGLTSFVMNKHP